MDPEEREICFIVVSDDFGEHPSSLQHIIEFIPPNIQVLWINTIGMRTPRFTWRDLKKIAIKTRKMLSSLLSLRAETKGKKDIQVIQPPMIPFMGFPIARKINKFFVCFFAKKYLKKIKACSRILITTVPNASDYIGRLGEQKVVYYCVDDYSEWPGLQKKVVKSLQDEVIEKADVFIATSEKLSRMLAGEGREVFLLTHGVDANHFRQTSEKEHKLLKDIPKPRVGYFGLFDDRSNQSLIKGVARKFPGVSFVITGNIETDISSLKTEKNIYFTGSIPYGELPAMAKGWDLCMLPYKVNALTEAIQPLKLKEYLATGKPVLCTPIKEALRLKEFLLIGDTVEAWGKNIDASIKGETVKNGNKIERFLQEESWEKKAERFLSICFQKKGFV